MKTQAWVLNAVAFSEHSLIIDCLTSHGQKIKARLKGVRSQASKSYSPIQPGSQLSLVYKEQHNTPWVSVQQQTVLSNLPIKAYREFLFFAHLLEIAHKIDYNPEAGTGVYQTLNQALAFLNSSSVSNLSSASSASSASNLSSASNMSKMQFASPTATAALFFYSTQIWHSLSLKIDWKKCKFCHQPAFKTQPKPQPKTLFRNTTYHFHPIGLSLACAECEHSTGEINHTTLADWRRLEQSTNYQALVCIPVARMFQSFKLYNQCAEAFANVSLKSLTLLNQEWLA